MKMKMLTFTSLALVACLVMVSQARAQQTKDIVDTAVAAGSFKTLAKALAAADLVGTLKGPGPFTVFAPTDEAFAKLPAGTVEDLLKPENKEKLQGILTYHVAAGKAMSSGLKDGQAVKTVNGKELTVKIADGKVMAGNAQVTKADVAASNGVTARMPVRQISSQGRDATGVRVMNLDDGATLATAAPIIQADEDDA